MARAPTIALQAGPPVALPADVRLMHSTATAVFVVAALALCIAAGVWLSRWPVFAIRSIQLEGEVVRNSESSLRAHALHRLTGSFVTLDLQQARGAFEAVPWVRHAVVRKVWPMRLSVELEEHEPEALWVSPNSADRLVNSHGEVFEANVSDVEDEDLPRLAGPEGSAGQMLALLRRLEPLFEAGTTGPLVALDLSARGAWRVRLQKGGVVELGRGTDDELVARTQQFVQTLPRIEAAYRAPLVSADLRHAGGYAIRLKGVTTQVPAAPGRKR